MIKMFDTPGVADPTYPFQDYIDQINENVSSQKIDVILIVLDGANMRQCDGEIYALTMVKSFIEGLKPENIFVVITKCNLKRPSAKLIEEKLESLLENGVEVPRENVILFDDKKESLEEFVAKMVRGDITFKEEICLEDFDKELDKQAEKANLQSQLAFLRRQYEKIIEERRELYRQYIINHDESVSNYSYYNCQNNDSSRYQSDDDTDCLTEPKTQPKGTRNRKTKAQIKEEDQIKMTLLAEYRELGFTGQPGEKGTRKDGLPKGSTTEGKRLNELHA